MSLSMEGNKIMASLRAKFGGGQNLDFAAMKNEHKLSEEQAENSHEARLAGAVKDGHLLNDCNQLKRMETTVKNPF